MRCQAVVPNKNRIMLLPQTVRELLGHANGTVLATRAADCHGQVAAVCLLVMWYPMFEKAEYVFIHSDKCGLLVQEIGNFVVQPGESSQFECPIRVWQTPQIEDEVGIGRNTVFESE